MTLHIESRHHLSPNEVDAIEDRLIDHNGHATGRHDSQGLGFVIRDEAGAGVPRDTQFFAAFRHLRVSLPDLQHESGTGWLSSSNTRPLLARDRNPKLGRIWAVAGSVRQGPAPFASPHTLVNGIVRAPRNRLARGKTELPFAVLNHLPIDLGIPDRRLLPLGRGRPARACTHRTLDPISGQTRHALGAPRLPSWPDAPILSNDRFLDNQTFPQGRE